MQLSKLSGPLLKMQAFSVDGLTWVPFQVDARVLMLCVCLAKLF